MANEAHWISVDPGIRGTGFAVWQEDTLAAWGNVFPKGKGFWVQRMRQVIAEFEKVLRVYPDCRLMVIEQPMYFSSAFGNAVATSGDLIKLASVFGGLLGLAMALKVPAIEPVPVTDWKGQLPKSVTEKRVRRAYPNYVIEDHALDAVGLGIFWKGKATA